MKAFASFEEYKTALANTPSQRVREELLAEADACSFSAWQMAVRGPGRSLGVTAPAGGG